jgi:hypothetical protein
MRGWAASLRSDFWAPMTVQEGLDIILGKKPKKKAEELLKEAEKKSEKNR